MKERKVVFLKF